MTLGACLTPTVSAHLAKFWACGTSKVSMHQVSRWKSDCNSPHLGYQSPSSQRPLNSLFAGSTEPPAASELVEWVGGNGGGEVSASYLHRPWSPHTPRVTAM